MRKSVIFSIIVVILAIIIAFIFDSGSDAQYTSSSERERGVSLLYDTLRYMDYPVRANRRPLTHETDLNDVYIIIQPQSPRITPEIAQEMLGWVENGGRLIFLTTYYPYTEIDYEIKSEGTEIERHFTFYSHGSGEVVTGNARNITNIRLYENSRDGQTIESTLERWNNERAISNIFFAEYYHGYHTPETFIGRLPLVIRLIFFQMIIFAIFAVWHLGKRFGNPTPYYDEVEREENEYVRALARLYMAVKKKEEKINVKRTVGQH